MTNTMATENSSSQMICISSLTAMGSQQKCVEATLLSENIQGCHVGKQIVDPVTVRRILLRVPNIWHREFSIKPSFCLALVIDTIESNDSLQKDVELWMARWIFRYFEQRLKEVYDDLLKIIHQSSGFVDIEEPRNLYQPSDVVGEKLVVNNPSGKFVPFINTPSVDGDTPLNHLVFT